VNNAWTTHGPRVTPRDYEIEEARHVPRPRSGLSPPPTSAFSVLAHHTPLDMIDLGTMLLSAISYFTYQRTYR
jgi:hypothetical protein